MKNLILYTILTMLIVGLFPTGALAALCTHKEYAEYKDEALTAEGRQSMAKAYCVAEYFSKLSIDLMKIAKEGGAEQDAKENMSDLDSCRARQSKIRNALTATKASKTLKYINGSCKGAYTLGDK